MGLILLLLILPSSLGEPPTNEIPAGEGTSWFMPETHHLFLNSTASMGRTYPLGTGEPDGVRFDRTESTVAPRIVTAESLPVIDGTQFSGNVTIRLFAALESDNFGCRVTNPVPNSPIDAMTSFTVRMTAGGAEIGVEETNREVMEFDWQQPHEFTVEFPDVEFMLGPGDVIGLEIDVHHNCLQAGYLFWNAYDAASGIVLEGDLFEPELSARVDLNRVARVELTPISPWGPDDYLATRIELVGPHPDWIDAVHGNHEEAIHLDHFEEPHGTRIGEGNRTVWTWTANGTVGSGIHVVDACIVLRDQDPNEDCHVIGVDRFMSPPEPSPLLPDFYLAILLPVALLAWLGASLRIGLLPWPGYLVLAMMAICSIAPAMALPDIAVGSVRDEAAAPPFTLLAHGGGDVSLSDLMQDNDVLVLGIFEVDSPAAEIQRRDFINASATAGDAVAFAQMATGDEVAAVDLDRYADLVNGSWPLLMDEAGGGVASQLPTGAADSVVVIDKGGFVSVWAAGSMDHNRIVNEAKAAASGSGRTPVDLLSTILFGSFAILPLALLALPREKGTAPDAVLLPGAGLLGTAGAAALGFAMIALPMVACALVLRGSGWVYVEVVLAGWLVWHAFSTMRGGSVPELRWVVSEVHGKLPKGFREWRSLDAFEEDAALGLWLAWLTFLIDPLMLAQGVSARAMTGIPNAFTALAMLAGFLLMSGISILLVRGLAAIAGPFSRIGGMFSQGARPRLWGTLLLVMGVWYFAAIIAGPLYGRFA